MYYLVVGTFIVIFPDSYRVMLFLITVNRNLEIRSQCGKLIYHFVCHQRSVCNKKRRKFLSCILTLFFNSICHRVCNLCKIQQRLSTKECKVNRIEVVIFNTFIHKIQYRFQNLLRHSCSFLMRFIAIPAFQITILGWIYHKI